MKPITELNNQSLLDASTCGCSCPEHEEYTPLTVRVELERRLDQGQKDRNTLEWFRIQMMNDEPRSAALEERRELYDREIAVLEAKYRRASSGYEREELKAKLEDLKRLRSIVC